MSVYVQELGQKYLGIDHHPEAFLNITQFQVEPHYIPHSIFLVDVLIWQFLLMVEEVEKPPLLLKEDSLPIF
jgi:hypothetical protein